MTRQDLENLCIDAANNDRKTVDLMLTHDEYDQLSNELTSFVQLTAEAEIAKFEIKKFQYMGVEVNILVKGGSEGEIPE